MTEQVPTPKLSPTNTASEDRFAVLTKHHGWIQACCRSMGVSEHDLEDVTSDVFLKAYKGLPGFAGRASLRTWLWRVTRNEIINHFRRTKRQDRQEMLAYQYRHRTQSPDPANLTAEQDTHQTLKQALDRLPRTWATALHLFYWQHQSTQSIAHVLKVKPPVVRAYLFRGRRRLRQLMLAG